ncbi:uncharacterized protein DNG_09463 [Cephalotrichum gorgonifer]|uniref:Uncharacterized protein n=1 Tax=Cephalotrichum gorgonifer TaxID=2041049 RepID=A0AAE8N7B8_9PEZI|nr:uncharacterized protein DNG_09463 [Cephalotrichum gorgonifer]
MVLLASLAAKTLAQGPRGVFFASRDPKCLLSEEIILPSDEQDRGHFTSDVISIRAYLPDCKLVFRDEVDGKVQATPIFTIDADDHDCYKLPKTGLHWNVDCEDKEE